MKVLIVDDDPLILKVLRTYLQQWGHEVAEAQDGEAALQHLQTDSRLRLVVTDWVMPEMDGLELCRRARGLDRPAYLHIIMLTARTEPDDLLAGMEAGADAFLTKPLNAAQLQAQIRVAQRLADLEGELDRRLRELHFSNERMTQGLAAAAEIQQSLLPRTSPEVPGFQFAWHFSPCDELAGDMFNVFRLDEDHIGLYILDVTGHGVAASLLSVGLSHALSPLPSEAGLLKQRLEQPPFYRILSPRVVARELNERFIPRHASRQFFTFLYAILNCRERRLTFTRAGHPGPLRRRADEVDRHDDGGGPPIGVMEDAVFDQQTVDLEPGDLVLAYTDGLVETRNASGEVFGERRLRRLLQEAPRGDVQGAIDGICQAVQAFGAPGTQRDDVTLLGLALDES